MKTQNFLKLSMSLSSLVFFISCQNSSTHSGFNYTSDLPGENTPQQASKVDTTVKTLPYTAPSGATISTNTAPFADPTVATNGLVKNKRRSHLDMEDIKTNLGFTDVSNIDAPKVSAAAVSVVKIVIPNVRGEMILAKNLSQHPKTFDLGKAYQQVKDATPGDDPISSASFLLQTHNCIQNKIPAQKCRLAKTYLQLTGFITGDGSEVTTSLQNVEAAIKFAVDINGAAVKNNTDLKNMSLPILIFDSNGEKLIDETKTVKIKNIPETAISKLELGSQSRQADILPLYDFATIDVGSKIGEPLKKAASLEVGEKVFNLGYPSKTVDRVGFDGQDADGKGLYATQGTTLSMTDAEAIHGNDWGQDSGTKALWDTSALFTNADGNDEMSGGPVLNENGEYVGIFTGSSKDIKHKLTYGISIKGF